jgi:DNA repair ATPase RecN
MTSLVYIQTALKNLVSVYSEIEKIDDSETRLASFAKLCSAMDKLLPHLDPDQSISPRDDKGRFLPRPQNVDIADLKAIPETLKKNIDQSLILSKLTQLETQLSQLSTMRESLTSMEARLADLEYFIKPPYT